MRADPTQRSDWRDPIGLAKMPTLLLPLILALALSSHGCATPELGPVERAQAALEASAQAYREAPALRDTLSIRLMTPNAPAQDKTMDYALGAGSDVFLGDTYMQAIASQGKLVLLRSDVEDRYVEVPYDGDFKVAVSEVFGEESGMPEIPQIAMRTGKGLEAWLDGLRMSLLEPLEIVDHRELEGGPHGPSDEIHLEAANGSVVIQIDRKERFLRSLDLVARPQGAPEGFAITAEVGFDPVVVPEVVDRFQVDVAGRTPVASMPELEANRLATGQPAPDFELQTFDGETVRMADLRGRVVVFDFWASWCVPCWSALEETEALDLWAKQSGLPVSVYAIGTMENVKAPAERKAHVQAFWESQDYGDLSALLDLDDSVFAGFSYPGLPSVVVVDPEGKIYAQHSGEFANMLETLKVEVQEALDASSAAGVGDSGE